MTDIPGTWTAVPSRLGVTAQFTDGNLILSCAPQPETLRFGIVRASVLAFVIDAVAGITVDDDPDMWTLTSDMTVRMRPMPAPAAVSGVSTVVRQGRRSVTCRVEVTTDQGAPIAIGAIGFAKVPRRADDPPKPLITPEQTVTLFRGQGRLTRPLRDEAEIEVVDAKEGVLQVLVTPELRNPAGTMQGAMVALLAEAAAEELVSTRFDIPAVVTDLDLRYLGQTSAGPVRTRSRLLGDGPDAPVEVELTDTATGKLTTLVYARAAAVDL